MTEIRNVEQELSRFNARLLAAAAFVLFAFALLTARLRLPAGRPSTTSYATQAENNRISVVPIVPNRGLIVDRNGVGLANNYSAYTLEITPSKVDDIDTMVDRLSELVDIQPRDRKRFRKRLMEESKRASSRCRSAPSLTDEEVARFTAQPLSASRAWTSGRACSANYPLGEIGSHAARLHRPHQPVREAKRSRIPRTRPTTAAPNTSARLGLEQSYESELHGTTGFEEVETRRRRASGAAAASTTPAAGATPAR